jgi:hypothetical protein
MRRKLIVLATAAAAFAALAVAGLSEPAPVVIPRSAARISAAPLLGLTPGPWKSGTEILSRIDPRRLQPLKRPRTLVVGYPAWSYSPDQRSVALGVGLDEGYETPLHLRIIDVGALRTQKRIALGIAYLGSVDWVTPNRLLVVLGHCCDAGNTFEILVVDPWAGKVLSRTSYESQLVRVARTAGGLALLLTPPRAIGTAKFLVADSQGQTRSVTLDRIMAGWDEIGPDQDGNFEVVRQDVPALAVDTAGDRAYVVSGDGLVAAVDLHSLAVSYHTPAQPVSLVGRLRDFLEPAAQAKGSTGPWRDARWLGGVLVVSGSDDQVYTDARGARQFRSAPSGLRFIDTSSWVERTIDQHASFFDVAGDSVIASGDSSDSGTGVHSSMGLSVYGFDGRLRFHYFGKRFAAVALVYGSRAFVRGSPFLPLRIIDLRTGRFVGRRMTELPGLLLDG